MTMHIESFYPPDELETASPGRRLGGFVLELALLGFTLWIGWMIWFVVVAQRGQTPAKQLLKMYIICRDGTRAGGGYTWLREIVIKSVLFGTVISIVSAVLAAVSGVDVGWALWLPAMLWCLWDPNRQCLWDKVGSTYIAYSPTGFHPLTAADLRLRGEVPPSPQGPADTRTPREILMDLRDLRDRGLITDDQYEARRAQIVGEL